mmetsp:Transcript_517/g.1393  ORF Transcript_517/g.1393 Transcript_517/m.1393 type:complete len:249 (+) Transcript_517:1547-2293(+)
MCDEPAALEVEADVDLHEVVDLRVEQGGVHVHRGRPVVAPPVLRELHDPLAAVRAVDGVEPRVEGALRVRLGQVHAAAGGEGGVLHEDRVQPRQVRARILHQAGEVPGLGAERVLRDQLVPAALAEVDPEALGHVAGGDLGARLPQPHLANHLVEAAHEARPVAVAAERRHEPVPYPVEHLAGGGHLVQRHVPGDRAEGEHVRDLDVLDGLVHGRPEAVRRLDVAVQPRHYPEGEPEDQREGERGAAL